MTTQNTSSTVATGAATNGIPPQQRADLDIEYYRGLLLAERGRLEAERDQIRNRGLDMDGALPEEGEGGEEDTADLASAMMDKEFDLSVEDEIEEMLLSVDHALKKMEDGTYGICDMSGENIPLGRLELIPWASLTVECQALSEGE
jgi:DnaK suppressor protein